MKNKIVDSDSILKSDLWQSLEEAKKILLFTYNELSNMTTDKFSRGGDKEIRNKIKDFLNIED